MARQQRKSRFLSKADPRVRPQRAAATVKTEVIANLRGALECPGAQRNNKFLTSEIWILYSARRHTGVLHRRSLLFPVREKRLIRGRKKESHSSQSTGANGSEEFAFFLSFSLSSYLPGREEGGRSASSSSHRPIRKGGLFLGTKVPRGGRPLQVLRTKRVRIEAVN